jgi:hypothetical protein
MQTQERQRWNEMKEDFERQIKLKTEIINDFKYKKDNMC